MSSHGDDFKVTAVQLATLVSAMANGGKLLSPHISRSEQEEGKFKTRVRRLVNLDLGAWAHMVPGMVGAVNYGSGRRAYDPAATVVGKTGTCIEQGSWVGLFASYAPLVNPRLAVVVIARGADAHGHFPAAVAGQIYRDLNSRFGTPLDLQLATKRDPSISGRKVTALNEEEADETGSEALESDQSSLNSVMKTGSNASAAAVTRASEKNEHSASSVPRPRSVDSNLTGSYPVNNKVKLVLMPIPQRPSQSTHTVPTKP
jgi:membrane peptidoglycan carboxypeptidase